jgi:hypothetical protein
LITTDPRVPTRRNPFFHDRGNSSLIPYRVKKGILADRNSAEHVKPLDS